MVESSKPSNVVYNAPYVGHGQEPVDKITLSISCRQLVDLDTFSKSDPEVHVFIKNSKAANYIKIGKTEMILNNLNPDFTTTFTIDFYFEKE